MGRAAGTAYRWSHLAGPQVGPGSADGTGGAAQFSNPTGIVTDRSGNIYVADSANNTIRKISPSGAVTTLAGSAGQAGSADGIGILARFNDPEGLGIDSAGNLYVADAGNFTIRKITVGGVVTTFAGTAGQNGSVDGTGAVVRFAEPHSVAVDTNGNVYVTDSSAVRKITPSHVVTTIAGSADHWGNVDGVGTSALFSWELGVTVDNAGVLYVADFFNKSIRKIASDGTVSTPITFFDTLYPTALVADQLGNVYVTSGNYSVSKITPAGITTPVGGYSSQVGYANGIAIDPSGNLFVCDSGLNAIRKITPDGNSAIFAGSERVPGSLDGTGAAAQFNFPAGVAVDTSGIVYVADTGNHTVRRIAANGSVTTLAGAPGQKGSSDGAGSSARFAYPYGIAVDKSGNIYVADSENCTIRQISSAGVVSTIAGVPGQPGSIDGSKSDARFNSPMGIAVDDRGNIYVSDTFNSTIRKITAGGLVTTLAGSPYPFYQSLVYGPIQPPPSLLSADGLGTTARFGMPIGIAVDPEGNVYVADSGTQYSDPRSAGVLGTPGNSTIRKISPDGLVTTLAGTVGQFGSTDGLRADSRFNDPTGLALDEAGNVFVADMINSTIRRISSGADVSTIGGTPFSASIYTVAIDGVGAAAVFHDPTGIAVDSSGNIYVADTLSHAIRKGVPVPAPSIVLQPAYQSVAVGGSAIFLVASPEGTAFQWSKNGVVIPGATATSYTISNVQSSDAGSYQCAITGLGVTVNSDPAALTIDPNAPQARLVNISTRSFVGTSGSIQIAGIVIGGSQPKTILIRANGPALAAAPFNVPGTLADPVLTLFDSAHQIAQNDDWSSDTGNAATITAAVASAGAFPWTSGSKDAAIVTTLNPGAYTAQVTGKNGSTGVALVEVYEMGSSTTNKLVNLSTRSEAQTGANIQIAGFVIQGTQAKKLLIRANGPAISGAPYNVPGTLSDPVLTVFQDQTQIAQNDDWSTDSTQTSITEQAVQTAGAFAWPRGSKDAALVLVLPPGAYTAQVSGKNGTTGVSLIEVYEVP